MSEEKFSLRWNDFESSLRASFQQFRDSLLDVEILCSTGAVVAAHRLVLCACSEVLREALIRVKPALSSTSSPVLVLLDTDKQDLECLLDFMYRGEALVSQERLQSFLNLAEKLKVTKVLPTILWSDNFVLGSPRLSSFSSEHTLTVVFRCLG